MIYSNSRIFCQPPLCSHPPPPPPIPTLCSIHQHFLQALDVSSIIGCRYYHLLFHQSGKHSHSLINCSTGFFSFDTTLRIIASLKHCFYLPPPLTRKCSQHIPYCFWRPVAHVSASTLASVCILGASARMSKKVEGGIGIKKESFFNAYSPT